jgi:hypothetical protein
MTEPTSSSENASVAAILVRRGREDRDALLDELVALLSGTVAGVEVKRTLIMRRITAVRLPIGEKVYVLARAGGGSFDASRQHTVRGIAVRTDPMTIDEFLEELGIALDAELRRTEQGRDALRAWLGSS